MATNEDKVMAVMANIQAKDTLAITRDSVYIPTLGSSYTEAQLIAWLQVRLDFLQLALDTTSEELVTYMDGVYAALDSTNQDIADAILNNTLSAELITEANIENLVKVMLFEYITTP